MEYLVNEYPYAGSAELYTREAEQRLLATDGMDKLTTPNLRAIKGGKADG